MTMQDTVPSITDLSAIYASQEHLEAGQTRWSQLQSAFKRKFGSDPTFIARAPGRVNVIGEHIDYCQFSVLPAALSADICAAGTAAPSTNGKTQVVLANTNSKYPDFEFSFAAIEEVQLDTAELRWYNYVLASFVAMYEHLLKKGFQTEVKPLHITLLYDGSLPAGAGLSSSAAMTCSSCIAVLASQNLIEQVPKADIVRSAIRAENLTGVSCGGMDQAASVFSTRQGLLSVEFFPELDCLPLNMPTEPPSALVIANSLVVSDKKVTSKFHYNLRWVETRVACVLLAQHLGIDASQLRTGTLKELVHVYFGNPGGRLPPAKAIEQLDKMLSEVETVFGKYPSGVPWDQIYEKLGTDQAGFKERFHPSFDIEADSLHLLLRSRHVFSEAKRVYQFCQLLSGDQQDGSRVLQDMGKLMNESQDSCREVYECSCPEIDKLVDIARPNSLGSRLTGAGWGGSTVHLVLEEKLPLFMQALREEYYSGRSVAEVNAALFATKPSAGACVRYI